MKEVDATDVGAAQVEFKKNGLITQLVSRCFQ